LNSQRQPIAPAKAEAYRQSFITHVHLLIAMGFSRLDKSQLATMHEPAITGLIHESVETIFDDTNSPAWVDDYEIHDDPPIHDSVRTGKERRRVDIKLASRRTRPRCRFCFEAKSLNKSAGVSAYLGKDGLGQFITGAYSADQTAGGMLAYIQTESCNGWSAKVAAKIEIAKHRIGQGGEWLQATIDANLHNTYQTIHKRPKKLKNIQIIHTFLDCTG